MVSKPVDPTLNAFSHGSISYRERHVLKELYIKHKMTTREIGDLFGVNHVTIVNWLDKHGIEVPDERQHRGYEHPELADREQYVGMYHGRRMKMQEMADELGCSKSLVIFWAHKHDIDTRSLSDYTGPENWKWNGGEGIYWTLRRHYPGTWKKVRGQIRERQDNECYMCETHQDYLRRELDVHHIIPIKSGGTNHPDNLMAVCSSCHDAIERFTQAEIGTPLMDALEPENW